MKVRKITIIGLIFLLAISIAACSKDQEDNLNNKTAIKADENQDKVLTDKLLNEEAVDGGQIYLRDEWVIGAIIIKDDVSEDKAKEIAQKYAEKLKEKYKDKRVNVQAILRGNNIANIELE